MMLIDDLVPRALIYCRKAPEPVIARFLLEAARDYCEIMPVWRAVDTIEIFDPSLEILSTIPDAEIVAIEHALLGERVLEPIALADLDDRHPTWMADQDLGTARYITQLAPATLQVYPRETGMLTVRLHLKPSLVAETLPDALVSAALDTVVRGAVGKMMALPDTEYTNPALAAAHLAFFASKTTFGAKLRHREGQQGARLRTKARYF